MGLFARLAVFAGGWTVEAAEAVWTGVEDADIDVLAGLGSLADKHLVAVEMPPASEPRYGMLDTIREYAGEQLAERGEEEPIRAAHAAYFTALAEEAEPELTGSEQAVWLGRLELEHENLRTALGWTLQWERAVGLRLAGALWRFWYARGYAIEGRHWLEGMLAAEQGSVGDGISRAKALKGAGVLAGLQGDYERARALHEASLQLSRELEDTDGIAGALNNLGIVAWQQGDLDRAATLLEESLEHRRALGDMNGIAGGLHNLGVVAHLRGKYDRAVQLQEESLQLYRELGDKAGMARTLHNLGSLALQQADNARAKGLFDEVLRLNRELRDRNGVAGTLESLGIVAQREGDFEEAAELFDESLRLLQQLGNKDGMAFALVNVAAAAESREEHERATRLLGAAEITLTSLGASADRLRQQMLEEVSQAARKALGSGAYEAAWQQGQAMSLEQAVADALGEHR
jgi:tetratricopeptide (TPR) repeat protein